MSKPEYGPLQGRFDIIAGTLRIDEPWHVSKTGEPVKLITGNIATDIQYEMGLLRELGRRFDASAEIGDQYIQVAASLKRKLTVSGER